jgi:hypothetical protein
MAEHLENLAEHYGKMAMVLRESEAGEIFEEGDMQGNLCTLLQRRLNSL